MTVVWGEIKAQCSGSDMPQCGLSSEVQSVDWWGQLKGLCRIQIASSSCLDLWALLLSLHDNSGSVTVVGLISSACLSSTRVSRGNSLRNLLRIDRAPRHDQTYCCQEGVGTIPYAPLLEAVTTLSVPSFSFPDLDILVSPWVIDNSCFLLAYLLKALVFLICIRVSCIYDRKSLHLYSLLRTR